MLTVHQAAALLGVDASKILSWTSRCQCIAIVDGDGILKLPKWQFEPEIWLMIEEVLEGLGTTDAWELLCFLESPARGLGGLTPRVDDRGFASHCERRVGGRIRASSRCLPGVVGSDALNVRFAEARGQRSHDRAAPLIACEGPKLGLDVARRQARQGGVLCIAGSALRAMAGKACLMQRRPGAVVAATRFDMAVQSDAEPVVVQGGRSE